MEVVLRAESVAAHVMIETDEAGFWSDNAFMVLPDQPVTLHFYGYKEIDKANFKETLSMMSVWDTYNSCVCSTE